METTLDTITIGAGIAGLTLASELVAAGRTVAVLERSDAVGGAIRTAQVDGFCVEEGPTSLLDTHPEVTALLGRVGLADQRIFAQDAAARRYIVRGGRPIALPLSPGQLLTTPLFSWGAKLRLLREPFIPAWDNRHEETIAGFVRRRLGDEILDYAVNPFVGGVYAGDPGRLGVKHAFPKLYALEQRYGSLIKGQIQGARERRKRAETSKRRARMYSFCEGLGALPAALSADLEGHIQTGATVVGVAHNKPLWHVTYRDDTQTTNTLVARSVVYTGRLTALPEVRFTPALDNEDLSPGDVPYPPVTVLGLGFEAGGVGHPLDGFGLLVPEVENRHILGVLFSSTLFPYRAPEGHVLLTVFVGGTRQPDLALLHTDKLLPLVLHDLRELLSVSGEPVMTHRCTWPQAIPQYNVGYGCVQSALQNLEENHPGLYFGGNYRDGISVPDTIKSSIALGRSLNDFLAQTIKT